MLEIVSPLPSDVLALPPSNLLPIRLPIIRARVRAAPGSNGDRSDPRANFALSAELLGKRCTGLRLTETSDLAGSFEDLPPTRQTQNAKCT
jgi:hypothetical protein